MPDFNTKTQTSSQEESDGQQCPSSGNAAAPIWGQSPVNWGYFLSVHLIASKIFLVGFHPWKIAPFYGTLTPIQAAALKQRNYGGG